MDNIIDRLKKIQALALKGVPGGEREAAQALLEKLMKKYNVSLEDIEEKKISRKIFEFHGPEQEHLLMQTIYKVANTKEIYDLRNSKTGRLQKNMIAVFCTEAQAVEIRFLFDFYSDLWEREKKALLSAFIQKHRIFGELKEGEKPSEISDEELAKMFSMMQCLSDETPMKRLKE